ncbi:RecBCD enzyme subunit RecC [Gammaproteobacteria bacterium]
MNLSSLPAGLMLVHGNQPEALRDLLVTWMKRYPLAPLENEVILVQSNGIAQWLKLALAADIASDELGGCGIAAALDISLPSTFLWRVYRSVLGKASVPEISLFDKPFLIWRLMRLLPELIGRPEYCPLRRFLDRDADRRKRFQLAERLADLFDQYQVYRADWLDAWERGEDMLIKANGTTIRLPEALGWQPSLWRALLDDVRRPLSDHGLIGHASRASVHEAFLQRANAWTASNPPKGLPRRVMVFGISSLPRQSLEVLALLGRWTQVLMCVPNPCEHYWADIISDKDLPRAEYPRHRRRANTPAISLEANRHQYAHPLLAAWGKQGRDFIALLNEYDSADARIKYQSQFSAIGHRIDLFYTNDGTTLLRQLQDDIRDLRPLAETRDHWPAVDTDKDTSIRFHIAHGPRREVEILHDQLLAAFNHDASLRPRDIIVMVSGIDVYAPYIQAVFGQLDRKDPRYLPFTVADQVRQHSSSLIKALGHLLDLPQSRISVSDVFDLLEVPAVRLRFGINQIDLPRLHRWIKGANIRWGLHDAQRASLNLPARAADTSAAAQAIPNTWLFGLRRMLLGYAVGQGAAAWRGIEPYDEIGGLDAALLGPLIQFLDRLDSAWRTLEQPTTVATWCARLRAILADFFAASETHDAFTLMRLELALQQWQQACDAAELVEPLPLSVVGPYWLSRIDEGGLSQPFLGGAVTFATLMPMRAIPFRYVCLLGMNDGEYPRSRPPLDFDLMGRDYRPGDRSRREDDRYLFMEALLSARDALHIFWVGRSITDNSERTPSVLVSQLRDHLRSGWRLKGVDGSQDIAGKALVERLTVEHRLQPFSPAYFSHNAESCGLFTYAHEWLPRSFKQRSSEPLAPMRREEPLAVRDLEFFLKNPVKTFFRERLKVFFELEDMTGEDEEPFALDDLRKWQLQDELIKVQADALSRKEDLVTALRDGLERIARRGELATGAFGEIMAESLAEPMETLFTAYQDALARWSRVTETREWRYSVIVNDQTLEIRDWLEGIRLDTSGNPALLMLESSSLVDHQNECRYEKLIRHWVRHLACQFGEKPLTTIILSKKGIAQLQPLERVAAEKYLNDLLFAWHEGMCRPLPLAARAAFALLRKDSKREVRKVYEGDFNSPGEVQHDPYLERAYPDFTALSATGEFVRWAERLLRPLMYHASCCNENPSAPGKAKA